MSTEFETIKLDIDGHLAVLTLDREEAMNALSSLVLDEIGAAVRIAESDSNCRVLLIVSHHPKAFIAGADIKEMVALDRLEMTAYSNRGHTTMSALESTRLVTVAAVNGFCLGGGFEIALSCDLIAAAPRASFAFPEVGLGLLPGFGGTQRFTRSVGMHRALSFILTAERFDAETAKDLGIVWKLFDDQDRFQSDVQAEAIRLAAQSPSAMAAIKELVRQATWLPMADGCQSEARQFGEIGGGPDAKEGMGAFLEKRAPSFKGQ